MRLVIVVPTFPRLSETFIVSNVVALLDAGVDLHVVCKESRDEEWANFSEQLARHPDLRRRVHTLWPTHPRWLAALSAPRALGRAFLRAPGATLRYLGNGLRERGARAFTDLYRDEPYLELDPDIVHFQFGVHGRDGLRLRELLGARVVVSFRGYDMQLTGANDPSFYDGVWRHADALHFLGEHLWRSAQERGCPPDRPHFLIPPALEPGPLFGIARTHRERLGTAERPARLLAVGRLDWRKGYDYLLEMAALLRDGATRFELRIVGAGPAEAGLRALAAQLGLGDSVEFLGARTAAQVRTELAWADVFLHAAVAEGFCNAVVEAQAAALPVVCSDAGGLPENVADGETGFVVPRRDAAAMAARVVQLSADPALRERMGQAGRDRVGRLFRLEDQVRAFLALYQSVLKRPQPTSEPT